METPDALQNRRELRKIRLKLSKWSNHCNRHSEPLINPRYLVEIEAFFEAVQTELHRFTLPCFPDDCRLLPLENVHFGCGRCFDSDERRTGFDFGVVIFWASVAWGQENTYVPDKLHELLTRLANRWEEVLAEARQRLGWKFRESDYPTPEALKSDFSIDWQIEQGTILLSSFLPSSNPLTQNPSPDIFEAVALARKLKEAEGNCVEQRRILGLPDERL